MIDWYTLRVNTYRDRVAVVTGGSRGIGEAIARELTYLGASVVVIDRSFEDEPATRSWSALTVCADVGSKTAVESAFREVIAEFGRIDLLVNNAGIDRPGLFVDSTSADWAAILDIDLVGTLNCCHQVLPTMIGQGAGAIVNIASDAGRVGSAQQAVYSAAKGGVIAFSKSLAREVARHSITVNCVCPGPSDTPMTATYSSEDPRLRDALVRSIPMRRLAQPAEVAAAVTYLGSQAAAYVTGQTLSVSGGLTMA